MVVCFATLVGVHFTDRIKNKYQLVDLKLSLWKLLLVGSLSFDVLDCSMYIYHIRLRALVPRTTI